MWDFQCCNREGPRGRGLVGDPRGRNCCLTELPTPVAHPVEVPSVCGLSWKSSLERRRCGSLGTAG